MTGRELEMVNGRVVDADRGWTCDGCGETVDGRPATVAQEPFRRYCSTACERLDEPEGQ